jgi:hypothetical protein
MGISALSDVDMSIRSVGQRPPASAHWSSAWGPASNDPRRAHQRVRDGSLKPQSDAMAEFWNPTGSLRALVSTRTGHQILGDAARRPHLDRPRPTLSRSMAAGGRIRSSAPRVGIHPGQQSRRCAGENGRGTRRSDREGCRAEEEAPRSRSRGREGVRGTPGRVSGTFGTRI